MITAIVMIVVTATDIHMTAITTVDMAIAADMDMGTVTVMKDGDTDIITMDMDTVMGTATDIMIIANSESGFLASVTSPQAIVIITINLAP